MIGLPPTPALLRQLSGIPAMSRGVRDNRIVIRPDGLATDFDTLLRT
ncbi:hypothetical protein [Bradyrhizobium liaoningense]|nr:hypothetical protein [Bradyrhizobium liaoningense]